MSKLKHLLVIIILFILNIIAVGSSVNAVQYSRKETLSNGTR